MIKSFCLRWDNRRMTRLPDSERLKAREAMGVVFDNGLVAIDLGITFESLDNMETYITSHGDMVLVYQE